MLAAWVSTQRVPACCEEATDPLGLGLQMVLSPHVSARNQTRGSGRMCSRPCAGPSIQGWSFIFKWYHLKCKSFTLWWVKLIFFPFMGYASDDIAKNILLKPRSRTVPLQIFLIQSLHLFLFFT